MPETGFQIENAMKAPSSCFWSETHLVIWTRAGWHLSRLRPVGLALRALCPSLDGCALPGLHSLRSWEPPPNGVWLIDVRSHDRTPAFVLEQSIARRLRLLLSFFESLPPPRVFFQRSRESK